MKARKKTIHLDDSTDIVITTSGKGIISISIHTNIVKDKSSTISSKCPFTLRYYKGMREVALWSGTRISLYNHTGKELYQNYSLLNNDVICSYTI